MINFYTVWRPQTHSMAIQGMSRIPKREDTFVVASSLEDTFLPPVLKSCLYRKRKQRQIPGNKEYESMCVQEWTLCIFVVLLLNDPLLLQIETIIYPDWQVGLMLDLLILLF